MSTTEVNESIILNFLLILASTMPPILAKWDHLYMNIPLEQHQLLGNGHVRVVQHPRVMCFNGQLPNLISVVGSLIVLDFVVFMVG